MFFMKILHKIIMNFYKLFTEGIWILHCTAYQIYFYDTFFLDNCNLMRAKCSRQFREKQETLHVQFAWRKSYSWSPVVTICSIGPLWFTRTPLWFTIRIGIPDYSNIFQGYCKFNLVFNRSCLFGLKFAFICQTNYTCF